MSRNLKIAPSPVQPRLSETEGHTPWLTPRGAAEYLGIALGTLRNWTSARYVLHAKRGRIVRYRRDALDAWLSHGECAGRATLPDL